MRALGSLSSCEGCWVSQGVPTLSGSSGRLGFTQLGVLHVRSTPPSLMGGVPQVVPRMLHKHSQRSAHVSYYMPSDNTAADVAISEPPMPVSVPSPGCSSLCVPGSLDDVFPAMQMSDNIEDIEAEMPNLAPGGAENGKQASPPT